MIIEINKDIDRYKDMVAMGLTAKQLLCSIVSIVVGGGVVLLMYPVVGLTISAYIAIPTVAPIALSGFYSYHGMTFREVLKRKRYFSFSNKPLLYQSTEGEQMVVSDRLEQQSDKKRKKKKRKK